MTTYNWPLFLALITAHLLADFLFQSDKDIANKKRLAVQLKHTAIVAGLSYLLAGDWRAWLIPVLIGGTHFAIDYVKIRAGRNTFRVFIADQTAHLLVIVAVTWLFTLDFALRNFWLELWGTKFPGALELLAGIVLAVNVGGIVVGIGVKPYLDDLINPAREENELAKINKRGLLKGGKTIGRLERALIFFLVGIGKPEGVAFLVAAKSIFRFGDLADRQHHAEAEYITIGTLMSFSWGLVSSWLTWWICANLMGFKLQ